MDRAGMLQAMTGARATHARLMHSVRHLDDAAARGPSLLPGWTRAHLLTHIARNADSHVRVLEAAVQGELVEQYAGGYEGRAAAIEAGAGRSAAELVDDVDASARALFDLWQGVPPGIWDEGMVALGGGKPAWISPYSRWRETEIHHVDLDIGYSIANWPPEFVEIVLTDAVKTLEDRLPPGAAIKVEADDLDFTVSAGVAAAGGPSIVRAPSRVVLAWVAGRLPVDDEQDLGLPHLSAWL